MFRVTHSYNNDTNTMFNRTLNYKGKTIVEFCTQIQPNIFNILVDGGHHGPYMSQQVTLSPGANLNERLQKQVELVEELFISKFNLQIKIPKWSELNHEHRQ